MKDRQPIRTALIDGVGGQSPVRLATQTGESGTIDVIIRTNGLDYSDIPGVVAPIEGSDQYYLLRVDNDIFGTRLQNLGPQAREYFRPFDTVIGRFWLGGESDGFPGVEVIKHRGRYAPNYRNTGT